MATDRQVYSDFPVPPGRYMSEIIEDMGMSQAELARRMDQPVRTIRGIASGAKAVTADIALQLDLVLGVPAYFWTRMEAKYQLTKARNKAAVRIKEESDLVVRFPYSEIAKRGLVKPTRKREEKVTELRRFFGVASLNLLRDARAYAPAFRRSVKSGAGVSWESLVSWLRVGELEAAKVATCPYDPVNARASMKILRLLTREKPTAFQPTLEKRLAEAGIALVLIPHFPKTHVNGATFWARPDKAVLMVTIRGGWADIFWFSLFHELGHILLHGRNRAFLEKETPDPAWKGKEKEADEFARDNLIPPGRWLEFVAADDFSSTRILSFADEVGIAPGIVVGRLQHDKLISFNRHTHRVKYQWAK